MKKSSLIVIAIIVILVVALVSFRLGFTAGKKSLEHKLIEAQEIIDYYFPVPEEIFSVNGEVKEIKDNVISLEITPLEVLPLPGEEAKKEIIKVVIGEEAKIVKSEFPTDPNEKVKQVEINLDDFETGDWIYVSSEENIKDKKEFTANYIELMQK